MGKKLLIPIIIVVLLVAYLGGSYNRLVTGDERVRAPGPKLRTS